MSIELKPCPFCGADPHDAQHIEYGRWAVTCRCGASGAGANTGPNATDAAKIKAYQDARSAWNTRTAIKQEEAQQPATGEPVRGVIGMGAQALAGELAQAVAQDDADPEGHDMSAGLFGPNVSAWLRKVAYYAGKQPTTPEPVVSRNPFASRCYTMSESHLSGHRLIVGFEKLVDAQDAHEWVARQGRGDFTHPAPSVPHNDDQQSHGSSQDPQDTYVNGLAQANNEQD